MKTKKLVLRIISMVFGVLLVLPLFTNWLTAVASFAGRSESSSVKFADFTNFENTDAAFFMTIAKIAVYVALILAIAMIVFFILQIVMKNENFLKLFAKLCGILLIVVASLGFLAAFIWCLANGGEVYGASITYLPGFGGFALLVLGLVAGITGLVAIKNKK